jgi:UDP-N-acetylmuramate--alanine ligase
MTRIHLIGIGGTGISAIARVLLEMGYAVSGSDRADSQLARELQSAGATISIGHRPENIRGADLVVRSSAIRDDNPEVRAARAFRIPVMKRAEFLGSLLDGKYTIAVAGTHGKTTTTAMIVWLLSVLGKDPSFIVGGVLANLGVNARAGKGNIFVIEADEYDRMFLGLKPNIEVVTNIEYDHPDCYPSPDEFQAAFVEFMYHLNEKGTLVSYAEDPGARDLMEQAGKLGRGIIPYGLHPTTRSGQALEVYTSKLTPNEKGCFTFDVFMHGKTATVDLQVPGEHNVLNALAALVVTSLVDLPLVDSALALGQFTGTGRRFEVVGEVFGIVIIDDYAHHPTEIRTTLAAARIRYPSRRIWAIWQPHTYSRTRALMAEFASAFNDADEVIVTEIYAARESKQDLSSIEVIKAMHRPAHYIANLKDVSKYLIQNLQPGDVMLVLSAGDADKISSDVLTRLREKSNTNENIKVN